MKSKNIKKNKDSKVKWCKFCERWKKEEEYSTNGKCLECRRKHKKQQIKDEIKKEGLAAYLLKNSSRRAFYRCGKKKGYENVDCAWKSYHDIFNDLKNTEKFWDEWNEQSEKYEKGGFAEGDRPTLDRISPSGHYEISNIQCLSQDQNRLKAKNAATHIFFTDENGVCCYKPYPTIKAAALDLDVRYEELRRNRDVKRPVFLGDERYFIQSAN